MLTMKIKCHSVRDTDKLTKNRSEFAQDYVIFAKEFDSRIAGTPHFLDFLNNSCQTILHHCLTYHSLDLAGTWRKKIVLCINLLPRAQELSNKKSKIFILGKRKQFRYYLMDVIFILDTSPHLQFIHVFFVVCAFTQRMLEIYRE